MKLRGALRNELPETLVSFDGELFAEPLAFIPAGDSLWPTFASGAATLTECRRSVKRDQPMANPFVCRRVYSIVLPPVVIFLRPRWMDRSRRRRAGGGCFDQAKWPDKFDGNLPGSSLAQGTFVSLLGALVIYVELSSVSEVSSVSGFTWETLKFCFHEARLVDNVWRLMKKVVVSYGNRILVVHRCLGLYSLSDAVTWSN